MLFDLRSSTTGLLIAFAGIAMSCRPTVPPGDPAPAKPPAPAPQPMPNVKPVAMTPTTQPFVALDFKYLHNVHQVTSKLYSGSAPDGPEGLKEIASLGVKTIIDVDGMAGDADTAGKLGMTYVHLPFGYDGVPDDRARQIAKAVRDLPGPIYLHCHHGKHRSAAAVATACVINGSIGPDRAEEVLKTFGTGLNYKGLWKSARDARPMDNDALSAVPVVYAPKVPIDAMAEVMLKIDFHLDNLKATQKAGWAPPKDHPDLDPPHEALQLEELMTELGRTPEVEQEPAEYHRLLKANIDATVVLKNLLAAKPVDTTAADAAMKVAAQSCVNCHAAFRD